MKLWKFAPAALLLLSCDDEIDLGFTGEVSAGISMTTDASSKGEAAAPSDAGLVADASPLDAAPDPACIVGGIYHMPNPAWTPGRVCSEADPNFSTYRYKGHVAYCTRNVQRPEKDEIAKKYGVPKTDYSKYEFDHYIPLSAGGSDQESNIWPQPIAEARLKDKVEDAVYHGLKAGTMTQEEAVAKLRAWRSPACP